MTEPRLGARDRILALTTSFDEHDIKLHSRDPLAFEGYKDQLKEARKESGLVEACVWGWAVIDGMRCALIVGDFSFLGGSMGAVVGQKVARAFDAARRLMLPVVTVTASGGARMQEGMVALAQMAATVEARRMHRERGLAHVTLLTSPTTGGVYASFASLADVILAEPGATIGFAGPRVMQELTGQAPSADMHTAEFAHAHGLIDAIVRRGDQSATIGRALRCLAHAPTGVGGVRGGAVLPPRSNRPVQAEPSGEGLTALTAWQRVQFVRNPDHRSGRLLADLLLHGSIELRGDRTGAPDDENVIVRAGLLHGTTTNAIVIAQDVTGDGRIRPEGFRKAIRGIELAGRLELPLVTIIDTRGADPLESSEAGGVASSIAHTFEALLGCPSPTLALVTGEGGSGGALAMAVADRVIAQTNAVFSVIAPEGAAAILYRDASRAPELAERMKITADDLLDLGIVDRVADDPVSVVAAELDELAGQRTAARLRRRSRRWRTLGAYKSRQTPR